MSTKTMTVKRARTVEEEVTVEVTFPIYRECGDSNYAGSIPYTRWTEISRLSEDGTKLTVRKEETECARPDRVTEFSITKEALDARDFASELKQERWEHTVEASQFHALMKEAVRFMAETHDLDWQIGVPVCTHPDM